MTTLNNRKFIKAEEGLSNSVIYYDEDENKLIRHWKSYEDQSADEASTRSWRNNNPGNLIMGDFAKQNGAIGQAGSIPGKKYKFAVFPDYATGRKAQSKRLKEGDMYIDLTLQELPRKYTGVKKDAPDTKEVIDYRKAIQFFTKFDMERTIRSLNDEEYEMLLDAMKKHEGWREGREENLEVKKILGVHIDKQHTISEFLVGNSMAKEWISKQDAIVLTVVGQLHAVVVHTKPPYLRPKFHYTSFRELIC